MLFIMESLAEIVHKSAACKKESDMSCCLMQVFNGFWCFQTSLRKYSSGAWRWNFVDENFGKWESLSS